MDINDQLDQILTNFAKSAPGGIDGSVYLGVYNAILASPALLSQLNASALDGALQSITYSTSPGGDFNPDNGSIVLGSNIVDAFAQLTQSTDPDTVLTGENGFAALLAHEDSHADFQDFLIQEQNDYIANNGLPAGSSAAQVDAWIQQYTAFSLNNEAVANIQGWNAIVSGEINRLGQPLSSSDIQNLIQFDPFAATLFNKQSDGTYAPDNGITINSDGTISATDNANVSAASGVVSLLTPSTTSNNIDYLAFYDAQTINVAAQLGDGNLSLSFASLGLTLPSIGPGINGSPTQSQPYTSEQIAMLLASQSYGAQVNIHDLDDDSLITLSPVTDNGGSTLLGYASQPDPTTGNQESDIFDIGSSGNVYYFDKTVTSSDGTKAIEIGGLGDNLSISGVKITLDPGAQATVNGDNNNFTLTDNSGSSITIVGQNETISTAGNTIVINGDGSSVTLTDAKSPVSNTIQMNGNNQTLTATQAYGSTVTAASGSTGETINGSGMTVNAGVGSQFALNGMSLTYNGGANTQLNIAGGFNTATLGDGSQVTLSAPTTTGGFVGLNTINESNGTVIVAFNDSTYGADTLNGSGNTITSASGAFDINGNNNVFTGSGLGSYFGITGDNNTFSNSSGGGVYLLRGSNNTVSSGNGGTIEIYSGTGNTLTASGATVELVAMGTTTINGSNDTFDLDSTGDDTINVSGSGNTIDAVEGGQLNLVSGSNFDVYIENGTINVGANVSAILELDDDQITASNGDSFQIVNGDNTFTAAAGSTVTFSDEEQDLTGDSITIAQGAIVLGDKTEFTINGDTNAISGGDQDVIILTGSDDFVSGTNSTITFNGPLDGGDNSLSISGTGNKLTATNATIAFIDGQTGDSLQITGVGDTLSATDKSIDFYTTGGNATVIGAGDTLTGSGQTLALSGSSMTDATVISLASSTITADSGNFFFNGYGDTFTGAAGSQLNVSGYDNTINISNATITVADNTSLTIVGSNDQIIGGNDDSLTITGTNDAVTATNSSIAFGQNNAGDTVTGAGDSGSNWSAPDPDLPPGDNGGYSPPSQTAARALFASSHSKYAMGAGAINGDGAAGMPDLHSLVHAMAAFHTEGQGMAMDSLLTASSPTEHLHLAAVA